MKLSKKVVVLFAALLVFSLCSGVFASAYYSYNVNLPLVGQITVCTGVKQNTEHYATNIVGDNNTAYVGWLDYRIDKTGQWVLCSQDYTCTANLTHTMSYTSATPNYGSFVRLRTKPFGVFNTNLISGSIEY